MKLQVQVAGVACLLAGMTGGFEAQAASQPDVVVKSITYSPANPKVGDNVVFTVVVQNIGNAATPAGKTMGVDLTVDGVEASWSDNYKNSLAAGASVTLTANGGPQGVNYYKAVAGSHRVEAWVNDLNYFPESNTGNNKLTVGFSVASGTTPTPTPKPSATPVPVTGNCAPAPSSSLVVNVKNTGAKGDGRTDDTAAIQKAISQVQGTGGTVSVPAGTYMVNVDSAVNMGSNMTLRLDSGATLKAIPTSSANYDIVRFNGVSNASVVGGTLLGERSQHQGSDGEYGMGVGIYGGNKVYVDSVVAKETWGDGVYIGEKATNVTVCNVTSDHNRRQGLSIVSANGVVIKNSIFSNTDGTNPQSGIDIEPNSGEVVTNVQILNSQFLNNHFYAIELWGDSGNISNVTVDGNTMKGNGDWGMEILGATNCRITNNRIEAPPGGVLIDPGSTGITVTGNTIITSRTPVVDNGSGNTVNNNH